MSIHDENKRIILCRCISENYALLERCIERLLLRRLSHGMERVEVTERAREVLSQTTVRVLEKATALDTTRPCEPWIMGIAGKILLENYGRERKRRARHTGADEETTLTGTPDPRAEIALEQVENLQDLLSCLSILDEPERCDLAWYCHLRLSDNESTGSGANRTDAARKKAALRARTKLMDTFRGTDS